MLSAAPAVDLVGVNDAPLISVPSAQTVDEDVPLVFSTLTANAISVDDADAGTSAIQVTVSATNGTLTLGATGGLSFSFSDANGTGSGDGTADASMTFRGTLSDVNAALNGLTFSPTADFAGSSTLSIAVNDLGNTATGGALSDSDSIAITVTALNDAPVNTVPGSQIMGEDTTLTFNAANGNLISVSDADAGSSTEQVTLTATHGTLTLSGTTGLSFSFSDLNGTGAGDGTADASLTLRGTLSAINAALAGLTFTSTANYAGPATVTIVSNDLGNTGSGGALTDSDVVSIAVVPDTHQDAPVNTVPGAQSVAEDTNLVFSAANGNSISISDDAAAFAVQVTLTATNGTLTLSKLTDLSFSFSDANGTAAGDGTADATLTFRGTQAAINAALEGMILRPTANFAGAALLTITTNDLGNTPNNAPLTDTDTVNVTVTAVNDAPINNLPGAQITTEGTAVTFNAANGNAISISDVDAASGQLQVMLTATNGTVTLGSTTGLSFSFSDANGAGDGTADATMTFRGALSDINTALNGLVFTPAVAFHGTATLAMTTSDLGNSGSGGAQVDADVLAILVNSLTINEPPLNVVPGAQTIAEDTTLTFSAANGNAIVVADADAATSLVQVSLTAANGTLTLAATTGLSFTFSDANGTGLGDGTADAAMTFRGTMTAINAALNGLTFTPTANFNGAASVTVATNDLGSIGTGGAQTDTDTIAITVTAVNDAPVNIIPSGFQITRNSRTLVFSTANSNAIQVSDVDAGSSTIQVSLAAVNGTLTLASTTGLSFSFSDANGTGTGDGTADTKITFRGTISAINAALDGLRYTPIRGAFASRDGNITITTNDLGATGSGGALTDTDLVTITHNATAFLARMHRLYNPNADMHFFTRSQAEFDFLVSIGWRDETTARAGFDVMTAPEDGALPLHRLYNRNNGAHYYTVNSNERDFLVARGWTFEGDEGFVFAAPAPGAVEVFRLYNRNTGVHLFTESVGTRNAILAAFPGVWVQHSSLGFAFAVDASGSVSSSASSAGAQQAATVAPTSMSTGGSSTPASTAGDSSDEPTGSTVATTSATSASSSASSDSGESDQIASAESQSQMTANVANDGGGEEASGIDSFWSGVSQGLIGGHSLLDLA